MTDPIPLYQESELLDVRLNHWPGMYANPDDGPICGCSDPADASTWVYFTIEHILDVMRATRAIEDAARAAKEP